MTILEISPAALALLLLASLVHGAVVALLYCIMGAILNLRGLCRLGKIPPPRECAALVCYKPSDGRASKILLGIADVFITIVSACLLLVVNFIFNDGAFRLFTIPASALGFVAANATLGGAIRVILTYLILCVRKLLRLILAPVGKLVAAVRNIIIRIINFVCRKLRIMRMKRYTKTQFCKIAAAQRDGMPP